MKYIGCKKCGAIVSNQYKNCPNCGFLLKMPGKGFAITSMVLGIVACYYTFTYIYGSIILRAFSSFFNNSAALFGSIEGYYPQDEINEIMSFSSVISMIMTYFWVVVAVVISLCFGYAARKRGYTLKMAKSGIIMSYISISISTVVLLINIILSLI